MGEDAEQQVKVQLSKFDLVIPIILSAVQHEADLYSTIQMQIGLDEEDTELINFILKTKPDKTLFILDGLDEYILDKSREITQIMQKKLHNKTACVITSRPEAVVKMNDWSRVVYKQAELQGFSQKHIRLFINNFFGFDKDGHESSDRLFNTIFPPVDGEVFFNMFGEVFLLQKMASNPGSLGMLCSIYDANEELVIHKEKLCEKFIILILKRWESKGLSGKRTEGDEILLEYKHILEQFGKLASKREKCDFKLNFSKNDLDECLSPEVISCGFLYKSAPLRRLENCQFQFVHKTVQEYLIAYYLTYTDFDNIILTLAALSDEDTKYSVIRFCIYCTCTELQTKNLLEILYNSLDDEGEALSILDQYQFLLHQEPVPCEAENVDYIQLPVFAISTNLPEHQFRLSWNQVIQDDEKQSWIIPVKSHMYQALFILQCSDDQWKHNIDYCTPDDDDDDDAGMSAGPKMNMTGSSDDDDITCLVLLYIHKYPLLIRDTAEGLIYLFLQTAGNIHI